METTRDLDELISRISELVDDDALPTNTRLTLAQAGTVMGQLSEAANKAEEDLADYANDQQADLDEVDDYGYGDELYNEASLLMGLCAVPQVPESAEPGNDAPDHAQRSRLIERGASPLPEAGPPRAYDVLGVRDSERAPDPRHFDATDNPAPQSQSMARRNEFGLE